MSVDFYKQLFETSVAETEKVKKEFLWYVMDTLKSDLGENYYDFIDFVTLDTLKGVVECLEDNNDIWETPDNKARDLSAAYRMVEYFSTGQEYQAYVQDRRDEAIETS
jgi:hypothetical protein